MKVVISFVSFLVFIFSSHSQAEFLDWIFSLTPNPQHQLIIDEVGGSNYVFWSVGDYIGQWTEEAWRKPGNLKPVIGRFHENPQLVKEQLYRMYAQGQRKIAIMIWYSVMTGGESKEPVVHHMINANLGRLPPMQEYNLREFLKLAAAIGFNEVHVRFAQQWLSDPISWEHELQYYNFNTSFIFSTRGIVEEVLAPLQIKRLYDLGAELGGLHSSNHRFNPVYTQRLWAEYVTRYGNSDTVGFSYAMAPGRISYQYQIYKKVGVFPKYISIDVYGTQKELYKTFLTAFQELKMFGAEATPFIIQEAYYNDLPTLLALKDAQSVTGMNIKTILQWPLSRIGAETQGAKHITEHFPEFYFNYLGVGMPLVRFQEGIQNVR